MEDHHYPIDANINEKINDNGDTLLILLIKACMSENLEEIKKMVRNITLIIACTNNMEKNIKYLLKKKGTKIEQRNGSGLTSLMIAKIRNMNIIQYLIDNKENVNLKGKYNISPLILACYFLNIDLVRMLISQKCRNKRKKDEMDNTPLLIDCYFNNESIINDKCIHNDNDPGKRKNPIIKYCDIDFNSKKINYKIHD
ncbi:hypothetical protein PIROE2DRAFT_5780 [Piromyces sp. E2]|nr:hypothetical protein PIROE2DRAFT_5780 [Piromyces sp. E2]|eukprot:OUM66923.1 hypothetical protein PIROE2DRAFT_5780 [Piromyces sp. E2]